MYKGKLKKIFDALQSKCICNTFGCCGFFDGFVADGKVINEKFQEISFFGDGFDTSLVWSVTAEPIKVKDEIETGCNYPITKWSQNVFLYFKFDNGFCGGVPDIDTVTNKLFNCLVDCGVVVNEIEPNALKNIFDYRWLDLEQKQNFASKLDGQNYTIIKFYITISGLFEQNGCGITNNCISC